MTDLKYLALAADELRAARHVVVFTGAGVSAESGIPTFRDPGGLWHEFPPEQFATIKGLMKVAVQDSRRFAAFLLALIEPIVQAEPNAAHRAIAELERHVKVTVITQNIDGLHQAAGSTTVCEVHGSLFEIVTLRGRHLKRLTRENLTQVVDSLRIATETQVGLRELAADIRPLLGLKLTGAYRPNIVLFGEAMAEPDWTDAMHAAQNCDCFISVGTSATVMPAAQLPFDAEISGAKLIEIDPDPAGNGIPLVGPAGEVLPRLLREALSREPG